MTEKLQEEAVKYKTLEMKMNALPIHFDAKEISKIDDKLYGAI